MRHHGRQTPDQPRQASAGPPAERDHSFRILTQGTSSITASIADAVVIKDGDLFFLCDPNGNVPRMSSHGYGLFHHDCRYLDRFEVQVCGVVLTPLVADASRGFLAMLELTNPELRSPSGEIINKETLGLTWLRSIARDSLTLKDELRFRNYSDKAITFPLQLDLHADFRDIFTVRGLVDLTPGEHLPTVHQADGLQFRYHGADDLWRTLTVRFSVPPLKLEGGEALFQVTIAPRQSWQLNITLQVIESRHPPSWPPLQPLPSLHELEDQGNREAAQALQQFGRIRSDSLLLGAVLDRCLKDLHVLSSRVDHHTYIAAGLPWFGALFGRDSAIAAIQLLSLTPQIAADTLYLLASFQGTRHDPERDEQPGKILHEMRVGELANINAVPYTPYFGSVDSTLLFLILMGLHAQWTGSLTVFRDLQPHVLAALRWLEGCSGMQDHGYVTYHGRAKYGLINQGWKDSGNAIVNADGSLATPPVALVEVQGYAYMAMRLIAGLFERDGQRAWAEHLRRSAADLQLRFERDFWLPDKHTYALALQRGGRPCAVISSNPGQALWTGIASPARARAVAGTLLAPPMFTGWGVRTLSADTVSYNPIGYHVGTVWPHDNSLIAAGLRQYGLDTPARHIAEGIFQAAAEFNHFRLPEVFSGFSRQTFDVPVTYPVADKPQAWAAGAVPLLLQTLLGLQADGFAHRLRIVRPMLPSFVHWLRLEGLQVGSSQVDLEFERHKLGVSVAVPDKADGLCIEVEEA